MADALDVLSGIGTTITVDRYNGPVVYDHGRATMPTPTTITLNNVSVQPMSPEEINEREELERARAAVKIYSVEPLRPMERDAGTPGDIVYWNGKTWRVVSVENHAEGVLDHYKSIAKWAD